MRHRVLERDGQAESRAAQGAATTRVGAPEPVEHALDLLLRSAGYDDLREEQRRRRADGSSIELGIGLGAYVEISNPVGETEFGEVEITEDGGAILRTGSHSHGQGHETTFAMIAAERLGLPVERVET